MDDQDDVDEKNSLESEAEGGHEQEPVCSNKENDESTEGIEGDEVRNEIFEQVEAVQSVQTEGQTEKINTEPIEQNEREQTNNNVSEKPGKEQDGFQLNNKQQEDLRQIMADEQLVISESERIPTTQPSSMQVPSYDRSPAPYLPDVHPTPGRVVYNAVPMMNSAPNDTVSHVTQRLDNITIGQRADMFSQQMQFRRPVNPAQRSIYNRSQPARQLTAPSWYTPPDKPVRNVVYTQSQAGGMQDISERKPTDFGQRYQVTDRTRKTSAPTPYVGSQVIASETGPSLTVLLRRPTSERQWGFTFYGGSEYGCPPFVNKVVKNSLAFQHGVELGDVIVSICKALTVGKTQEQLKAEILRAGNELDLILIRRGVDLAKLEKLAPQALQSPIRSPPPSASATASDFSFGDDMRLSPQGRSFRPVKTKSLRILEQQLAAGQATASTMKKREQLQRARTMPSSGGPSSTFTYAYGQNESQGHYFAPNANRSMETYWSSSRPPNPAQEYQLTQMTQLQLSPNTIRQTYNWNVPQSAPNVGWDTQSEYGAPRNPYVPAYMGPTPYAQLAANPPQYPIPCQPKGSPTLISTSMTVPLSDYHLRPNRPT